jgi:uridine kinase
MFILVTGAAGSGTSTLGEALARRMNARFIEADSFLWQPTNPPFVEKRPPAERNSLLAQALSEQTSCVVVGSVMGWGNQIESAFALVIFLYVPTEIRVQRLEQREVQRFGRANPAFIAWAAQYDLGLQQGRSLAKHNCWLAARGCKVIRLEGNHSLEELLSEVDRQAPNPSIERDVQGLIPSAAPHVKR